MSEGGLAARVSAAWRGGAAMAARQWRAKLRGVSTGHYALVSVCLSVCFAPQPLVRFLNPYARLQAVAGGCTIVARQVARPGRTDRDRAPCVPAGGGSRVAPHIRGALYTARPPCDSAGRNLPVRREQAAHPLRVGGHPRLPLLLFSLGYYSFCRTLCRRPSVRASERFKSSFRSSFSFRSRPQTRIRLSTTYLSTYYICEPRNIEKYRNRGSEALIFAPILRLIYIYPTLSPTVRHSSPDARRITPGRALRARQVRLDAEVPLRPQAAVKATLCDHLRLLRPRQRAALHVAAHDQPGAEDEAEEPREPELLGARGRAGARRHGRRRRAIRRVAVGIDRGPRRPVAIGGGIGVAAGRRVAGRREVSEERRGSSQACSRRVAVCSIG